MSVVEGSLEVGHQCGRVSSNTRAGESNCSFLLHSWCKEPSKGKTLDAELLGGWELPVSETTIAGLNAWLIKVASAKVGPTRQAQTHS